MNNKDIKELPKITIPLDVIYYNYGLNEEFMTSLNTIFNGNIGDLSRYINVSNLEAITFASNDNYEDAINSVDRGFIITNRIIPSKGSAAMTLPLKRGGNIKCHIVFNVDKWTYKLNKNRVNLLTNYTLSIIAHEMVHVEIMNSLHKYKSNICFPISFNSLRKSRGFEISKSSIEEFIACKKTYFIDEQNIVFKSFNSLLIKYLNEINENQKIIANDFKIEIKNKSNYYDACFNYTEKSYKNYEKLLIISSYYLGLKENNVEHDIKIKNHDLFKYIEKLLTHLKVVYKNYPYWEDLYFKNIQDLLEEILINEAKINFITNVFGDDYFTVNLKIEK